MNTVITIATVPAILAMTNLAKKAGLPSRWAAAVAVILGVTLSVAQQVWGSHAVYQAAASGLLLGLSAAGVYDVSATAGSRPDGRHYREET